MVRTATDSKSQTARQRARKAMADELERARNLEAQLATVFTAIDAMEEAKTALGGALTQLRDLGVAQSDLAAKTGLSAREVTSALRSAKEQSNKSDESDSSADNAEATEASASAEAGDGSDTN